MFMRQCAQNRFAGDAATPAPPVPATLVFGAKFNSPDYKVDNANGVTGSDTNMAGSATGGKFSGYIHQTNPAGGDSKVLFANPTKVKKDWVGEPFTVQGWVKVENNGDFVAGIFMGDWDGESGPANSINFEINTVAGSPYLKAYIFQSGSLTSYSGIAVTMPTAGTWVHFALTSNGTTWHWCFNGTILRTQTASSKMPQIAGAGNVYVRTLTSSASGYDVCIDAASIHSECLYSGSTSDAYTVPSAEY